MKNRLFRLAPEGSAMALTTMAIALATFHGQSSMQSGPATSPRNVKATAHEIHHAPAARAGVVKVDFDFDPSIFRHPVQ